MRQRATARSEILETKHDVIRVLAPQAAKEIKDMIRDCDRLMWLVHAERRVREQMEQLEDEAAEYNEKIPASGARTVAEKDAEKKRTKLLFQVIGPKTEVNLKLMGDQTLMVVSVKLKQT